MAKGKKKAPQVQADSVLALPVAAAKAMTHRLSDARKEELLARINEGVEFYERAFGVRLSDSQVLSIMAEVVEGDKKRLFLQRLGSISEADILWFMSQADMGVQDEREEEPSGARGGAGDGEGGPSGGEEEGSPE